MPKILMVCTANVCRSPMALAVAQKMVRLAGRGAEYELDSAGTHATRGARLDARARAVLEQRQYPPGKARSRRVVDHDFDYFDLILAMDASNMAALRKQCPSSHQHKLQLLLAYAPSLGETEVPDPYHGSLAGFERVLVLCESGVRGLLI